MSVAPMPGAAAERQPLQRAFAARPRRTWLWAVPLLLALAGVIGAAAWLQYSDNADQEATRHTLIADVLTVERQLRQRLDAEQVRVSALGHSLSNGSMTAAQLAADPTVVAGLRSTWLSLTWLDPAGQTLLQLPEGAALGARTGASGFSAHLQAPVAGGGLLVVRLSLTALLAAEMPWWMTTRYVARLLDADDEVLATTASRGEPVRGDAHRIALDAPLSGTTLELQSREAFVPWYRTVALVLLGAVLALLAWATLLLRRQLRTIEAAEAAARTEAGWRRAVEDALTVGLRARDLDGRLVYANARFLEMTGFAEQELVGRTPPLPYWPADAIEASFDRMRRTLSGGAPREGYEARWRRKDGSELDVIVLEAPLLDGRGRQVGWMASVVDVTERRRAAERLATQARLMTLGEIASSLAHELNQPLMAISSYNAGLQNALAQIPGVDARILGALHGQAEQASHAGRVVQRIRAFLARRAPQQERCRLADVVDAALALVRSDLVRHGVTLAVEHDEHAPDVLADPVLIEQVIVNLVRNAEDALGAQPEPRRIVVSTRRDDGMGAIEVRDNGPGLTGRGIDELAAPFYSTKPDGMGLGLAICRSIVEAHVGRLQAGDAEGGGAWLRVLLPAAELAHAA